MWLLDVNMPRQLKGLLAELGIPAETANERGWGTLISCLLTRDRLFGESVAGSLIRFPGFSIVHVTLPQARAAPFLASFRAAWGMKPIKPIPGQTHSWP